MATPSISKVATNLNWIGSQQVTEALLSMPEVLPELVQRYGKQDFTLDGLSKTMGGVNYISNMNFRHSEENFLHEVLKVEANGNTYAAGALGTYTIASAYTYDYPVDGIVSPYITLPDGGSAITTIPLYPKQVIAFPDGTQAIVQSVSGTTFTAYPRATAGVMPQTSTTDIIVILGNQVGEAADMNPSRDSQLIWYFGNMSNMNGSYQISGNARADKMWISTDKGNIWFYYAQMNEAKRLKNEREMRILTDTKTTNTTFADIAGNETSVSFEGLIPFIESYGNQLPYNLISGITLQDFEELVLSQLMPNVAASEYALWSAGQPMSYFSQFVRAEGKNGGIVYAALGNEGDYTVKFDFKSFNILGHTFHAKHYGVFDYKNAMGAVGQPYPYMFLGMPLDKSDKTVNWDDITTSKNTPQFVIHYQKSPDGYKREWEEFMLGGANGVYTEGVDRQTVNYRSTFGFEGFAPNRYFKGFKE